MTKKKEAKFEDLLKRLQEISDLLDNDEIGIDETILLYEEGIELSKLCNKKLNEAELKITELKKGLSKDLSDTLDIEE